MTVLLFRHLADPGTFFRPFDADRKPNRFRSTYRDTLRALDDELRHLRATEATARELGAGGTPLAAGMTVAEALDLLLDAAGATTSPVYEGLRHLDQEAVLQEAGVVDKLYREASRRLHPDRPGGDAARFVRVTEARDLLRGGIQ